MKRALLLLVVLIGMGSMLAQRPINPRVNNKKVNVGIKTGFNSSIYLISTLNIAGIEMNEIQNNYKMGYYVSLLTRINFKKHFIQPSLSYNINKSQTNFDYAEVQNNKSRGSALTPNYASINSTIHSIDLPFVYGYNFIKKSPYQMCFFVGPKVRYIWNSKARFTYENFGGAAIEEDLRPFNIGGVIGVGVSVSNFFFDFTYEQVFNNISQSVSLLTAEGEKKPMTFNRRDNVISFSLGVLF